METGRILDIAKAFSDEMRISIVGILASGEPKRYTAIINELGLDATSDSSKFAYHMGILTDAGIAEKVDDSYRITQGGRKVFQSMVDVSEKWADFKHQDSLKQLKGHEVNKLIWSRTLIYSSPLWLLDSYALWFHNKIVIALPMFAIGVVVLSLGAYWLYKNHENFWKPNWDKFLESCAHVLGKNGLITGLISILNIIGLTTLPLLGMLVGFGQLKPGLILFSTFIGCLLSIAVSVYLSWKLMFFWNSEYYGIPVLDYSNKIKLGYISIAAIIFSIGFSIIAYGVSQTNVLGINAAGGVIGGGVGVLAGTWDIWKNYRRYSVV